MASKAKRHTHKYRKAFVNGNNVWACADPDCPHYMPKHQEALVEGCRSICWQCNNPTVIMDELAMSMERPICTNCKLGIKLEGIRREADVTKIFELMKEDKLSEEEKQKKILDEMFGPLDDKDEKDKAS